MKRKYTRHSVFTPNLRPPTKPSPIPEDQRVPEEKIDLYRKGWKKFNISMQAVSRMTGIKYGRLIRCLSKDTWLSMDELKLIDRAMVRLVLEEEEMKKKLAAMSRKKKSSEPSYWDNHFRNIYDRPMHKRALSHLQFPLEDLAPEETIDMLFNAWKEFDINLGVVAAKCSMKPSRIYKILHKSTWSSIQETEAIRLAMLDILQSRKAYNSGQNPQRK